MDAAVNKIRAEEDVKDILLKQLEKLKHHSKINSTVEGFVFEEDGVLYKFTGNYAPMNQLLGLFKSYSPFSILTFTRTVSTG